MYYEYLTMRLPGQAPLEPKKSSGFIHLTRMVFAVELTRCICSCAYIVDVVQNYTYMYNNLAALMIPYNKHALQFIALNGGFCRLLYH